MVVDIGCLLQYKQTETFCTEKYRKSPNFPNHKTKFLPLQFGSVIYALHLLHSSVACECGGKGTNHNAKVNYTVGVIKNRVLQRDIQSLEHNNANLVIKSAVIKRHLKLSN